MWKSLREWNEETHPHYMWPHEGSVTNPDFQNVPKAPVVFSVTDTHITVQYFFSMTLT